MQPTGALMPQRRCELLTNRCRRLRRYRSLSVEFGLLGVGLIPPPPFPNRRAGARRVLMLRVVRPGLMHGSPGTKTLRLRPLTTRQCAPAGKQSPGPLFRAKPFPNARDCTLHAGCGGWGETTAAARELLPPSGLPHQARCNFVSAKRRHNHRAELSSAAHYRTVPRRRNAAKGGVVQPTSLQAVAAV